MNKNEPKALRVGEAHACLLPTVHVDAMLKALRETGVFTIERDDEAGTAHAYHTVSNREVFAAISKSASGPWIIRHHKELFTA